MSIHLCTTLQTGFKLTALLQRYPRKAKTPSVTYLRVPFGEETSTACPRAPCSINRDWINQVQPNISEDTVPLSKWRHPHPTQILQSTSTEEDTEKVG